MCLADAIYSFKWVKIIQISQNRAELILNNGIHAVPFKGTKKNADVKV